MRGEKLRLHWDRVVFKLHMSDDGLQSLQSLSTSRPVSSCCAPACIEPKSTHHWCRLMLYIYTRTVPHEMHSLSQIVTGRRRKYKGVEAIVFGLLCSKIRATLLKLMRTDNCVYFTSLQ